MGKYDWITKEQLKDLYITQNLSKSEIRKILGISETHCGRLLRKFNIQKSPELYKQLQSRVASSINKNLSKEKRQSRINKCKEAGKNNINAIIALKKVNKHRTKEHQQKLIQSQHLYYTNESETDRQERIRKTSK